MDSVTTNTTLTRYLKAAGNIKVVSGGRKFVHPLLYAKNSSFAARASLDTITLPVTDSITASEWNIRVLSGSVVLPELDIAMNAGSKEKLLDYADAKRMEAEISMSELLSDQVFSTSGATGNNFDSIYTIVSTTASTESTLCGGIDGSGNSFWRNSVYDTTVASFNSAQEGINQLDQQLNKTTFGTQGPKLIVTTKKIFTLYMLGLTSNARYTNMMVGDAGFKQLMYADIPFVFDDDCPTNYLYGLDTDNLKLQVLAQGNFGQSPFKWSQDQLSQSALMYLFANLTCGSRRTNFVMNSVS